ncbi:N-acetyltransferase [Glycomyces sp. TRM65418]|uniref:GNAT family N-acetyltransferase n=1 Tax=Glycomyces sp. TRM65418 TaxID=2867006 RepID=UPI001CE5B53E|nr:GNAT family N-acetyltransferase [Glycomyces sp. TRM65418]MCC3765890.1 N-acetyltransferase [Glycomyces sp. TRM65418]QZD55473.1 N-acetyltransferase [Glycomyces sp. TRM65418]
MDVQVTDAPEQNRYEARIGDDLVGFAEYRRKDGTITFVRTEVSDEAQDSGVGSALARTSLDEARAAGLQVEPVCPFYAGWIERHPEYGDLVHEEAPRLGEED